MTRTRAVLVAMVVGLVMLGTIPAPAVGQDEVTLTVTIETADGAAVPDADLTATWDGGSATAQTAANGKAFIDVPAGATIEIAVDHPDYIRNVPFEVTDAAADDVTITVYERAQTAFVVEDSEGPVDDASVTLFKHQRVAFAEQTEDGEVATPDIEAGDYLLAVEKPGYYDKTFEISLEPGTTPARTVVIERGTVTLHFNVTDPYFDSPRAIEGVTAAVEGVGSVQTQSNGKQQINVPVNTKKAVTFTKDGYETVERSIAVEEGDLTLDVSIHRADEINVTVLNDKVVVGQRVFIEVVDEYEDPVANGTVLLDGESVATTDSDGRARLTVDTEGEHTISVRKGSVDSGETVVTGVIVGTETTTTTPETTTSTATTTTPTATTSTTEVPIPGFGPIVALLGTLLGLGLARRRSA